MRTRLRQSRSRRPRNRYASKGFVLTLLVHVLVPLVIVLGKPEVQETIRLLLRHVLS